MNAHELFRAGRLDDAVVAVTSDVKARPTDTDARGFLAELLCLQGQLDRADAQLDLIGGQAPDAATGVALFRQLLRAEKARREFYTEGRVPEVLAQPDERMSLRLRASVAIREGDGPRAAAMLAECEEKRPHPRGTCDGKPFEDFRDLDDLTADVLEVLTSTGKYYWIPVETVTAVEFRPLARPRDLLWRRALLTVHDGPDGEVYLPAIYAGTDRTGSAEAKLAQATDWLGGEGQPFRGIGQRTFLVGEDTRPILEIGEIRFGEPGR